MSIHEHSEPAPAEKRPSRSEAPAVPSAPLWGCSLSHQQLLFLQRTAGNRAVTKQLKINQGARLESDRTVVQRRANTDPYHAKKWNPQTHKTYMPPGNPERTDLPGMVEEVEDVFKAGQRGEQMWKALAKAWVAEIFTQGFASKGPIKSVYQSEDDKETGGYSFSQKVNGVPPIVIHAHMERNHQPSVDIGATEMGPVHWKWEAWETEVKGQGGPIPKAQYNLLDIDGARAKYNADIIKPHLTGELPSLLGPVCSAPGVADLLLGAMITRFDSAQLDRVQTFLQGLKDPLVGQVKGLLSILDGGGPTESMAQRDVTVRTNLLWALTEGASLSDANGMKGGLVGLDEVQLQPLRPMKSTTGTIELRPLLGGMEVPPGNQNLSAPDLVKIRDIFDRVMGSEVLYNSTTAPMSLIGDIRKARETQPHLPMSSTFASFNKTGGEVIDKYQAADCVAMAQRVKDELEKIGIGSYVIGSNGGNLLNEIPDPERSGRARIRHEAARQYAVFSHASVVVPYREPGGAAKAIHIEAGMGPSPEFYKQYDDLFTAQIALTRKKYDLENPIADTAELQKKHIRCKWRMWFSDTGDQKKKGFIDLAEGSMFVTGADQSFLKEYVGAKINFKDVLANPMQTVTITVDEKDVQWTNIESLVLFLTIVAKEFHLGKDFVDNMLFLASNLNEYSEQILLGPIDAVRETAQIKEEVVAKKLQCEKTAKVKFPTDLMAADALLAEAADFVKAGNKVQAMTKYLAARTAYDDILKKV